MRRSDSERLALERLRDAIQLQESGRFDAACYLAGYALECALKARICRVFAAEESYPPQDGKKYYIHELERLLEYAQLTMRVELDVELRKSWVLVKDWAPDLRYKVLAKSEEDCRLFLDAVGDETKGLLEWLLKS